jgi:hypothetical protein
MPLNWPGFFEVLLRPKNSPSTREVLLRSGKYFFDPGSTPSIRGQNCRPGWIALFMSLKNAYLAFMQRYTISRAWRLVPFLLILAGCDREPGPNDPVPIPDSRFLYALIDEGYDRNFDKQISFSEAEAIIYLDVSGKLITSMKGLKAMTNLEELNCFNNEIESLDLSGNPLLQSLDCAENYLDSLDLSANPDLTFVDCSRNGLTDLNVSNNLSLTFLWCSSNELIYLDLSANEALGSAWDYTANEGFCYTEVDLRYNPFLQEVCVWELPFPPEYREICVNTVGSPQLVFTTSCLEDEPGR